MKRYKSFAYIPKKWDQNHVVNLENLFGEFEFILKFWKIF